jgi:hypothetical protein
MQRNFLRNVGLLLIHAKYAELTVGLLEVAFLL